MNPKKRHSHLDEDSLWFKDAIFYELHVKSFYDGNNDGIGDFVGLIEKLDYLQELGVNCLWLLPFFPSPLRDDGYDISDYKNVHPTYGTMKDFRRLVKEVHKRGMRIMIELILNHTSDQHPWFQAARKASPNSAKRNYYVWSKTKKKYEQARVIFTDSEESNWTWDLDAKAYYWHRFFHHQPDLNFENPAVKKEVLKIMRYWLDIGVDGLRLDAVPYLIEKDGTNCENLPETHAILKELRKEMDKSHPGRIFLAEANQWPADVRPYFGDGDECHMAYHFPLMPRIFMALRQEDRHPISEIMRQTPNIPENSQWALFLRNHDELTLEMVTDEERDYMYHTYATDHSMRLNLGIRRRLSPLVDHSRRRLELLNSILFSFPGTPIIYYGDEIQMGDNIFLGDRNGVRTPMQWTGDRNAGFSRADPAHLFSPVIMDPVNGYQAINVEAQERDPSSFLNWMKRMIALRKRFKIFGRGTLEFLSSPNRKVLTYVRRYQEDVVLCVANLSRFVQPVELDLSEFKDMIPIELLGGVEFPPIGDLPYFLTLGPHGFYWFQLKKSLTPTRPTTDWKTLTVEGSWDQLWKNPNLKKDLEEEIIPHFLKKQRWYGSKSRLLHRAKIIDWGHFETGVAPTFLVFIEAQYGEGPKEIYFIPLAVATGDGADALAQAVPASVVAHLKGQNTHGILHDALVDDPSCYALLGTIEHQNTINTNLGKITSHRTAIFEKMRGSENEPLELLKNPIEQSNSSIIYDKKFFLKIFRRMSPGSNPDYEIGKFIMEKTSFKHVPQPAGAMEYHHTDGSSYTLAILQNLVRNQGDGWTNALEELGQYFERVSSHQLPLESLITPTRYLMESPELDPPNEISEILGIYINAAQILGRRTAEMHLALSSEKEMTSFKPEPLSHQELEKTLQDMRDYAQNVLKTLESRLGRLSEKVRDKAHRLIGERTRLLQKISDIKIKEVPLGKIRCHGDYHLGQVLWFENDYIILDFEGEPARTMRERRAKQSPLKDVAGMLRSYSYASYAALFHYTQNQQENEQRLEPWANLWQDWISAVFIKTYRAALQDSELVPKDLFQFKNLLDVYILNKAFYEILYELNNRPDWIRIPINGILSL